MNLNSPLTNSRIPLTNSPRLHVAPPMAFDVSVVFCLPVRRVRWRGVCIHGPPSERLTFADEHKACACSCIFGVPHTAAQTILGFGAYGLGFKAPPTASQTIPACATAVAFRCINREGNVRASTQGSARTRQQESESKS
jgi:hypothetical protein